MPCPSAETFARCVAALVDDIAGWAEEAGAATERFTDQKQDEDGTAFEVASLRFGNSPRGCVLSPTPPSGFGELGSVRVERLPDHETLAILHLRSASENGDAGWDAIVFGETEADGYRQSAVNASLIESLL